MLHIFVRMETNEISTQQPVHNFFFPGPVQHTKYFKGWEGNVKKETYGGIRHFFADHTGQQHQLIIMHPYNITGLKERQQLRSKDPVRSIVALESFFIRFNKGREVVE